MSFLSFGGRFIADSREFSGFARILRFFLFVFGRYHTMEFRGWAEVQKKTYFKTCRCQVVEKLALGERG